MSRSNARESVFKLVFEYLFTKEKNQEMLDEIIEADKNKAEVGYISEVYNGIINKFDILQEQIRFYSRSFSLGRIFKVDLAILLVASYEMLYIPSIPKSVSINEALELSKVYSTEKSGSYINGVLSNFVVE